MSQKWMSDDDFFAFDDDFDDEGNNVSGAGNNNQTTNTSPVDDEAEKPVILSGALNCQNAIKWQKEIDLHRLIDKVQ